MSADKEKLAGRVASIFHRAKQNAQAQ